MSAAVASPPQSADATRLNELYGANKSLSLSVSAALAMQLPPQVGAEQIDAHVWVCERAAAEHQGEELEAHFEACRDAAVALADLAREAEDGLVPTQRRLEAVRRTHRHLRRLVWEVFDCEYVPCGHERNH
ncbi:MAG: hypothetical protein BGO11_00735 [Solirubrobacterales bacterium 70-9]|nr:MAG: hypothetical protein BGO11_00735 [Solirubrobacterales bacterium 70-9]